MNQNMKIVKVFAINTLLTALVIRNAFSIEKQFYPSVIYITRSKPSVAVITIEVVLCLILYNELIIKLFLGEILASEGEIMREIFWSSLLDSCFAFATFARNADFLFYFRFICLFGIKMTHNMISLRVRSMSTVLHLPKLFHIRFIGLLLYLGIIDVYQITSSALSLRKFGISVEMLYYFEYLLLLLSLLTTFGEYSLECIEKWKGEAWDEKVVYSNYLELGFSFLKTIAQFFMTKALLKIKVLPTFMIKNLVLNITKTRNCFRKVLNSFRAISRLDRLPNPRPEDLSADNMCSICRDQIQTIVSAKKLLCRHVFHISCLKAWLRRQQKCPTCRSNVNDSSDQNNNRQPEEEVENEN